MKTEKTKNVISVSLLGKILTMLIIILISLISFGGIYVTDKNVMKDFIPEYKLGMDLDGYRNIVVKLDESTETKKYDADGNLVTSDSSESSSESDSENDTTDGNITTVEEPVNKEEDRTTDNYKTVKNIIIDRLEYLQVENYKIKCDEDTGRIYLEVPEDDNADYIAQYCITKGEFKISDSDTDEVLLSNSDLKNAKVQYSTDSTGTTVFLTIEFNKDAAEKLKNISNTYVSSTDSDGNTTTKNIKMTIDDETIITTYFQEEIDNGMIQLSIGTSSDSQTLQTYLKQARNIAVLLNTDPMPLTYEMEINRFVYSDITMETIRIAIIVASVIGIVMLIYMIIKYRVKGLLGAILNVGFVAILLLAIRYGNVTLTLTGISAIALSAIFEYVAIMEILKVYKNTEANTKKELIKFIKNFAIETISLIILAVTFALSNVQELDSIGMVFFWATLIMIIYNVIVTMVEREAK